MTNQQSIAVAAAIILLGTTIHSCTVDVGLQPTEDAKKVQAWIRNHYTQKEVEDNGIALRSTGGHHGR